MPDAGHMCPSPQAVTPHQRTTPSDLSKACGLINFFCFSQLTAHPHNIYSLRGSMGRPCIGISIVRSSQQRPSAPKRWNTAQRGQHHRHPQHRLMAHSTKIVIHDPSLTGGEHAPRTGDALHEHFTLAKSIRWKWLSHSLQKSAHAGHQQFTSHHDNHHPRGNAAANNSRIC